ncbi:MAG: hypothetical protein ABSE59_07850 [Opitutaceae bacterium]
MDKAVRTDLIRAIYRAKAGVMAYVSSGSPLKVKIARPVVDRLVIGWPQATANTKRAPGWMKFPDAKPTPLPQIRRTARKSALTRIAEQLPAKLPRVLF